MRGDRVGGGGVGRRRARVARRPRVVGGAAPPAHLVPSPRSRKRFRIGPGRQIASALTPTLSRQAGRGGSRDPPDCRVAGVRFGVCRRRCALQSPARAAILMARDEPRASCPTLPQRRCTARCWRACAVVLYRPRDFRPGGGDGLHRVVVHRHGRQLGAAARSSGPLARHLSAVPCAGVRRRHRHHRADVARLPRRQHRRAHAGALYEAMLDRTPVVRGIYKSVKQIFETVFSQGGPVSQSRARGISAQGAGRWCSSRPIPRRGRRSAAERRA